MISLESALVYLANSFQEDIGRFSAQRRSNAGSSSRKDFARLEGDPFMKFLVMVAAEHNLRYDSELK